MRTFIVALTVVSALGYGGSAAAATGPERSEAVFEIPESEVYAECDGFDLMLSDMRIERTSLTWSEESDPVVERRHVSFVGTFTNSVTGKTGTFSGRFERVEDFAGGTVTLSGLFRQVRVDGQPTLVATGVDSTSAAGDVLFLAGHPLGNWEEDLCAYMA
jgi:hypothetical protein